MAAAFEALHGAIIGRVLPKLAGTMHGRELSFTQLTTIISVFIHGPMTIAEIAAAADITPTAASRMIDKLVKAGLMSRTEGLADRRQKIIDLTPEGRAVPPEWREATVEAYADVLAHLPESKFQELTRFVEEIVEHIPQPPPAFRFRKENQK